MATSIIGSEQQLRAIIKAPPGTVTAKIVSGPLGASSVRFLDAARLGVVVCGATVTDTGGRDHEPLSGHVVGGPAGFVTRDPSNGDLLIPGSFPSDTTFAGLLLMVPGVRHTLRVNGPASVEGGGSTLRIRPRESYAHCAKAFIRSELWSASSSRDLDPDRSGREVEASEQLDAVACDFIAASPFAVIGTSLVHGEADVSPRGDPAGFVHVTDDGRLFVPERPGNRIADTLRNVVAHPHASLMFVVPGDPRVLEIRGDAVISTDDELRARSEVAGRRPELGLLVAAKEVRFAAEPSLVASGAWDPSCHVAESELPTLGAMVADPNDGRSLTKRAMAGLTDRIVKSDYKRNLY